MRFHVLSVPHTVSSKTYNACAYTQKVVKFCKMMQERGHTIIHYGHEDSNVVCAEHVTVTTNKDFDISYGDYDWRKNFFKFSINDHAYKVFTKNCIQEIQKRKQPNDFVLGFFGAAHKEICDQFGDLIIVEPGIGYSDGHFAPFKVFESYAMMHAVAGINAVSYCNVQWYSVVIPNYFDLDEFEFSTEKDDYFLFLGRVYEGKGVHIAIQATQAAGVKLKVAGQGGIVQEMSYLGYNKVPDHVEELGYADVPTRKKLMSRARAGFVPTMFHEPFGGVQIEYLLSGTPTITSDWGAFAENNIHGVTGYRCRTFGDFVESIHNISKIDPRVCRQWAVENFSMERVAEMYEKAFIDFYNVKTGRGWYSPYSDLTALERYYPTLNPKTKG
jgi:glycosyltransferase involved in cell wall biosynthesis